jgi:LysR family transcriptional regulator for bpeEF and oprC
VRGAITVNESNAYVQCGLAGSGILQAPGITVEQYLPSGERIEVLQPYRPQPRLVARAMRNSPINLGAAGLASHQR